MYLLICITIAVILIIAYYNVQKQHLNNDPEELFPTEKFTEKDNIKSAKCPQCGKTAMTYEDVKDKFGLRRVGYATDIQSWCRECRRNKDEIEESPLSDEDLTLFDE